MHRIASALVLALVLAACGSDSEGGSDTTAPAETTETTAASTTEPPTTEPPTTEPSTTEPSTTEASTTTVDGSGVELAAVCDAFLRSLTPGQIEAGLDELAAILGPDAPPGVQDALMVLTTDEGNDIEDFWAARDSLDGYVTPICADRFAANIQPAETSEAAADGFYAAVLAGDEASAASLAPADVIARFDWRPYPDATTSGYNDVDGSFNMLLEPTVTVFCRAAEGVVVMCAFGE